MTVRLDALAEVAPRTPVAELRPADLVTEIGLADVNAATAALVQPQIKALSDVRPSLRPVREGDLLLARIAPSMQNGKLAIARGLANGIGFASTELTPLRPRPGIPVEWLRLLFRNDRFRARLAAQMTGSAGQQRLSARTLRTVRVAPPPDGRLLAVVLEIHEALDHARALREAVLREFDALPSARAAAIAADRPRGVLGDYGAELAYGASIKGSRDSSGPPLLRIPNVVRGEINLDDLQHAPHESVLSRYELRPGDVLIVRTNGNRDRVGRCAVFEGSPSGATFASYLIRIRVPQVELAADFLWAWSATPEARAYFSAHSRTSAGQFNINIPALKALPIPDVGFEEQASVVRLSRAARSLRALAVTQARDLDSLQQALLDRAFSADPVEIGPVMPDVGALIPALLHEFSEDQQSIVERMISMPAPFTLATVNTAPEGAEPVRRALRLLERLGMAVLDRQDEAESWRLHDPELDAADD
jgi:type I restriction enzyme S subunit